MEIVLKTFPPSSDFLILRALPRGEYDISPQGVNYFQNISLKRILL